MGKATPKDIVETIAAIQKAVPVERLRYRGMAVWAICRQMIGTAMFHRLGSGARQGQKDVSRSRLFSAIRFYWGLAVESLVEWFQIQSVIRVANASQAKWLCLDVAGHDHMKIEGQYCSPHLDSFCLIAGEQEAVVKIRFGKRERRRVDLVRCIAITDGAAERRAQRAFWRSAGCGDEIENWSLLEEHLSLTGSSGLIGHREAISPCLLVFEHSRLASRILDSIPSLKCVVLASYQSSASFGMIHACRQKGITVADLQHGKQGRYSVMYSQWQSVPTEARELLPDRFLVWGKSAAENLRFTPEDLERGPRPIVIGHLFLACIKAGLIRLPELPGSLLSRIRGQRRVILFTMQTVDDPLPECIVEAIRDSPPGWLWLIRCHPRSGAGPGEVRIMLKDVPDTMYETEESSKANLFTLLQQATHHVTLWSSVCYEAEACDVPTLIVGRAGHELYSREIDQGAFAFADTTPAILDYLSLERTNKFLRTGFIVADLDQARRGITHLLANES